MTSTFTPKGLEKPETGDRVDTWGEQRNRDLDLIDDELGGILTLTLTANKTLSQTDGTTDEANHRNIVISSSDQDRTVTFPASMPSIRAVYNDSSYDITFTVSGGSNTLVVPKGGRNVIRTDASEVYPAAENSGWFLAGENASLSGTNQSFTLNTSFFSEFILEFIGVSHNDGGSVAMYIIGGGANAGQWNIGTVAGGSAFSGLCHFISPGAESSSVGMARVMYANGLSDYSLGETTDNQIFVALDSTIGMSWGSSATFDAGTLRLWAR